MAALTSQEVATYHRDGYVVPAFSLSEEKLAGLRQALDAVIADNPDVRPEKLVSVHIEGRNDEGVVGNRSFLDIARDPDILDLVEQIIGPDIILWGCQAFCKPGGDGLEVPFHQDGQYWPIRPLATCTVWIAIDDSVVENGCLRVVAGSHEPKSVVTHVDDSRENLTLTQAVEASALDGADIRDVELKAGQMSLHDVYLVHGSNPNHSDKRRAGLAIRYMPATSVFERNLISRSASSGFTVDFSTRPLWLLRGEDKTRSNDFDVGHH